MSEDKWISAAEAARLLGVRAQTLYAYASRGLLRARAHPEDARRSVYRRTDVAELAARQGRSRKLADVASAAIAWGEPVLQSAITTVREGRLYYRGHDAVELSKRATLESAAALLIGVKETVHEPERRSRASDLPDIMQRLYRTLADEAGSSTPATWLSPELLAGEAMMLLDLFADAVAGVQAHGAIHQRLATAWGKAAEGRTADLIRRILVLLADHELNASTFAARVTASTGASLAASLLSGVATLSGPRHGGMGARVRDLCNEAGCDGPSSAVARCLAASEIVPGFGHPLYPDGDIRARAILGAIETPPVLASVQAEALAQARLAPNVDFALTAACVAHDLPGDAPFALFAIARSAGWLAHAIEQGSSDQLIRPRARYTGP